MWTALRSSLLVLLVSLPATTRSAPLILNEYNAVAPDRFLNGGTAELDAEGGQAADPFFGRVIGNGGDWLELVVIDDHLDLRGWRLDLVNNGVSDASLFFTQDALWADLRAGTIITVAEDVPDDPSYDPLAGDWWINVQAGPAGTGTYVTAAAFTVSNDNWQVTIRDAGGAAVFGPAGEGVSPASGVGSTEVMKLEASPSALIAADSGSYHDGTSSTFGAPNRWSSGTQEQDFSGLRGGVAPPDPTEAMYDPSRIIDVDITLAADDWDALRAQQRTIASLLGDGCMEQPFTHPFTWFPATTTVDGQTLANVGVRKKGFLGSLDTWKPSLKVDFSEFVSGQRVHGVKELTLNNAKQDPALIRQCLGYLLFARAGVPAPRCNFAHVRVNGRDLGIYVNVEEIGKPFLARHFADNSGNLYEGTSSDFHPGWVNTFEAETNEEENDRSDLAAVVAALEAPNAQLLPAVGALVDLDAFTTYWAMEALLGSWDGYTSGRNNFFVYHDPTSGKFRFLPWGIDGILQDGRPLAAPSPSPLTTLFTYSTLSHRLYQLPETWYFYAARLIELLDTVWDEPAILAEIDRLEALLTPVAGNLTPALAPVRAFVSARRGRIAAELGGGRPVLDTPPGDPVCLAPNGQVRAGFVAFWGTAGTVSPFQTGFATLKAEVNGTPFKPVATGATAGLSLIDPNPHLGGIHLHYLLPNGNTLSLDLIVDSTRLAPGATLPIDGVAVDAQLNLRNAAGFFVAGYLDQGVLRLDQASTANGGWLYGTLEAGSFFPAVVP